MLNAIETFFRKSRRWVSRSEWLIRLLRLTKTRGAASEPGLVLIQIDGLSRRQLEHTMTRGNLPFLGQLLRRHRYRLYSMYSGLPSSTPAATAELLYGVKGAVPAFSFYDRATESVVRMFEPRAAKDMDHRLLGQGPPLLAEGSAYAGIYTGGAAETHFCASMMGLDDLFRAKYPLRLFIILLFSFYSLIRVGVLLAIEFVLALIDCIRGLIAGQDLWKEIKFIPSRVGISIFMRELATIGAKIDVTRGLPVIYLNLVGYDEQSHRRGPSSRFAHWTLRGIDKSIKRIWSAARRSAQRDYDLWIFSDHGSEEVTPYPVLTGRTLPEAVAAVFDGMAAPEAEPDNRGIQSKRTRSYLFGKPSGGSHEEPSGTPREARQRLPVVAAMGPVAHIYLDRRPEDPERQRLARLLVEQARVPMVAVADGFHRVRLWTADGEFVLPDDAGAVFGPDHPFLEDMTRDFIALCHHQNAGDFVLWGWSRRGPHCTFPIEGGAHAGPGLEETHAFALLPDDVPLRLGTKGYIRLLDLHKAGMGHLGRDASPFVPAVPAVDGTGILRVMTYNVHSCIGIDGKLSPRRVARVIARYRPDVVALQEVDVGRARTRQADQARIIAEYLEMDYHFSPTLRIEEEAYGDCILSRLPMRLVKTGKLPAPPGRRSREPRGAVWVAIEIDGRAIQFVNTHLGLNAREKRLQMRALLGADWLANLSHTDPVIFCGDFNAAPQSAVWRMCLGRFRDVQVARSGHLPRRTWFGHYPIARIDHIFVDSHVQVLHVDVGDDYLARIASDHRPLFAELRVGP